MVEEGVRRALDRESLRVGPRFATGVESILLVKVLLQSNIRCGSGRSWFAGLEAGAEVVQGAADALAPVAGLM
jgi:hypothetical protein